jgi:hypothetical protein
LAIGVAGCNKQSDNAAQTQDQQDPNYDPASANMAPADQSGPVNESTASAPSTNSYPAPAASSAQPSSSSNENIPPPPPDDSSTYPSDNTVPPTEVSSDQGGYYDDSVNQQPTYAPQPPPAIPEYDQPVCPGPNYLWTPGYWGYQPTGFFWVPGVWVIAPYIGGLWTPGYWGWGSNRYLWHHGYWGPHIGYYGGVNYGHGYGGSGYDGGYWNHNNFYYNTSITRVNTTVVRNVYVHNVTINNTNRVSYNGGPGGLAVRPSASELAAARERHLPPLAAQTQHVRQASQDRAQLFSVNHGRPQTVALNRPLETPFRAPAAQPPVRGVANQGPVARPQPNRIAEQRPENLQQRPAEAQRPAVRPESQSAPVHNDVREARPQQEQHPNLIRPQTHPAAAQPEARPVPAQRPQEPQPEARPESRPAPEQRPQPQQRPESRPAPQQSHPEQQPQSRPEPHGGERPH